MVITNTDTNIAHSARKKGDGSYEVTQLPVGPYKIEVQKEGFEKYLQAGIVLQLNTQTVEVRGRRSHGGDAEYGSWP